MRVVIEQSDVGAEISFKPAPSPFIEAVVSRIPKQLPSRQPQPEPQAQLQSPPPKPRQPPAHQHADQSPQTQGDPDDAPQVKHEPGTIRDVLRRKNRPMTPFEISLAIGYSNLSRATTRVLAKMVDHGDLVKTVMPAGKAKGRPAFALAPVIDDGEP